jgi:hypothetical protein
MLCCVQNSFLDVGIRSTHRRARPSEPSSGFLTINLILSDQFFPSREKKNHSARLSSTPSNPEKKQEAGSFMNVEMQK